MRTLTEAIVWVKDHPTRKNVPRAKYRLGYGWSWSQLCAALCFWAVGATTSYPTATAAMNASGLRNKSRNPPPGSFVWFAYGTAGHVGFVDRDGLVVMASRYVPKSRLWGTAVGRMTIEEYENAAGAQYAGYTDNYGGAKFSPTTTPAGGGSTPIILETNMARIIKVSGVKRYALVTDYDFIQFADGSIAETEIAGGLSKHEVSEGQFNGIESRTKQRRAELEKALGGNVTVTNPQIDYAKLAATVADTLATRLVK